MGHQEVPPQNRRFARSMRGSMAPGEMRLWQRLSPTDLMRVGLHGERGEESLERMRQLYAGHDLLHLRQLQRIRTPLGSG